jgi:death-on-curing protein
MSEEEKLSLADLLLWAEDVLGIDAHTIRLVTRIPEAESALAAPFASFGGEDFYPDPAERAAILCSRLVRNHPFPDGNKRIALLAMLDQIERSGLIWTPPPGGQVEIAFVIEALASRAIGESEFTDWVRANTAQGP